MERLYNGIVLPDQWPPKDVDIASKEPMRVPYLENPPEIITVDIGRQLFVDGFLIENTTLAPHYHKAVKYKGNPVLYPKTPWEKDEALPVACPKSGGVWWDEKDKIYKMWYESGWLHKMAYAVSKDGIHWERPDLDIQPGTNVILDYDHSLLKDLCVFEEGDEKYWRPDSCAVFIDKECDDPSQRYKMFLRNPGAFMHGIAMTSADGIHWENAKLTSPLYDRSTIFYNPFRRKWIYSIRSGWRGRTRNYREQENFLEGALWNPDEEVYWLATDKLDQPNPYIGFEPQLYNLDAVAYESIMLGLFQIMYGPDNSLCEKAGVPKITELMPMYSRDGFHWSRPSRQSMIQASMAEGAWDRGYVQSVGGICIVAGDELWIYYTGFAGDTNLPDKIWTENGMYANGATGIAKLRRDGFVSMDSSENGGELLTRKLLFHDKKYLFVNLKGKLTVEILSEDSKMTALSETIYCDRTKQRVLWKNNFDLSVFNGKPLRLRFKLDNGSLYSFWFSDKETGESNGYLAAGAPLG